MDLSGAMDHAMMRWPEFNDRYGMYPGVTPLQGDIFAVMASAGFPAGCAFIRSPGVAPCRGLRPPRMRRALMRPNFARWERVGHWTRPSPPRPTKFGGSLNVRRPPCGLIDGTWRHVWAPRPATTRPTTSSAWKKPLRPAAAPASAEHWIYCMPPCKLASPQL